MVKIKRDIDRQHVNNVDLHFVKINVNTFYSLEFLWIASDIKLQVDKKSNLNTLVVKG